MCVIASNHRYGPYQFAKLNEIFFSSDINECLTTVCQHGCTNTEGSFTCDCNQGYTLAVNDRDCDGKSSFSDANLLSYM